MKRSKPLKAVESTAESAADLIERAGEFVADAYDQVQPQLELARQRGAGFAADVYDRVEPSFKEAGRRAAEAYERVQPTLSEARKRGAKLAAETFDKVHPVLDDALDKVTPAVDSAVKKVRPAVEDTFERVTPTVDLARDKVQNDFLPWLAAALYKAADLVKDEIEEVAPEPKRRSVGKTIGLIALAGAILAGVVYAVRKLVGGSDSGWETHEPSRPYVADPVADVVDKAKDVAADAADAVKGAASDAKDAAADVVDDAKKAGKRAADAVGDAVDDVKDKAKAAKGDASPLADSPYGEGSYVGAEPPEGFEIKGNERSMKYHLQGSGGYDRTITDVWFSSAEAAEKAGFVRAQR